MQSRRQARRQALRLLYQLDVVFGFTREAVESALVRWQRYSDERPADETVLYVANICLLYTSPSPRDRTRPRMPSSA